MNKILGKSFIGFILLLSITLGENPLKYAKPKLSEYGLSDKDGNILTAKSERDIFKYLDMEYLPPKLR